MKLVLGLVAVLALVAAVSAGASRAEKIKFGIVIDAGSSGSRINIYKWPTRTASVIPAAEEMPPVSASKNPTKITPGISSASPFNSAGQQIQPLIAYAKEAIPENMRARTPIFLMATAGMRVLMETSPQGADEVLQSIRVALKESGFMFKDSWAFILPGQSEGAFAWLATNYLFGSLDGNTATVAALDMGGASQQITFVPKELPIDGYFPLRVGDKTFDTYTFSFLRYGKDQARLRYAQWLSENVEPITDEEGNEGFPSPCFFAGQVFDRDGITVIGTGFEVDQCVQQIGEAIMFFDAFCKTAPCSIDGVYQPALPATMRISAGSSFYHVGTFFGCGGKSTPQCVLNSAKTYSGKTFEDIIAANPKVKAKFLETYGFDAGYMLSTLVDGFHFDLNREIYFEDDIKGTSPSWALGALLYYVGLIPVDGAFLEIA